MTEGASSSSITRTKIVPSMFACDFPLVPVTVDVSSASARVVDSFLWSLSMEAANMTVDEFAYTTCVDRGLPQSFQVQMALQLREQLKAHADLLALCKALETAESGSGSGSALACAADELLHVDVSIRANAVEYTDSFSFDPFDPYFSPEEFASLAVADQGLPPSMEASIAFRIREVTYNDMLKRLCAVESFGAVRGSLVGARTAEAWAALRKCKDKKLAPATSSTHVVLHTPDTVLREVGALWRQTKEAMLQQSANPNPNPNPNPASDVHPSELHPEPGWRMDNASLWVAHV